MVVHGIRTRIKNAILGLMNQQELNHLAENFVADMAIIRTKDKNHGDYACNVAMLLAKSQGKSPQQIAHLIVNAVRDDIWFAHVVVAGPGFINLTLSEQALATIVPAIQKQGADFGRTCMPIPKKVLIEFVSANPTGGLHLGHARGAFVGDALARLMHAAGYHVVKEYYVNDTGVQVHTLARTIHKRYRELFGESITIEQGEYPAESVKDIARALKNMHGDKWLAQPESVWLEPLTQFGVDYNLALIRRSLAQASIEMDTWFFEHELHQSGALSNLIKDYDARNMLYDATEAEGTSDKTRRESSKAAKFSHLQEGGRFLKTAQFGDEEDRIIQRRDGRFVYLTADLAYHHQKFNRGFDVLIDVFGADHAGHIGRIKAGMMALGHDVNQLKFVTVQMMRLVKNGRELKFSKRAGEVIGLDDLIEEVGPDVARFVFLMRSAATQFDLDIDQVTKNSVDNPVFYVQYGHARMASILAKALTDHGYGAATWNFDETMQGALYLPEERDLLLKASELADVVSEAAIALEPHRLVYYCQDLIKTFHSYFTKYRHNERIISDDARKTKARLSLVLVLKQTIYNALSFIGLTAPEYMEFDHNREET